ncbi:MAG: ABC transporter substrate-binding protein [Leucobacter sp.]
MKKSTLAAAAALAAGSLLLAGCSAGGGSNGGGGDGVIIGASLPLTGSLQAFGTTLEMGYQRAVDEVNKAGGIEVDGAKQQVELVVQDNASDGDKAAEQARSLVLDDGAVALLGPATPPLSIPVSSTAEQLKVPAIVTITPLQAWKGGNPDGWNYAWDAFFDETQMTRTQFEAADLVETNKKVALFTDTEEDGVVMGDLWEKTAPEFDYEIAYRAQFAVGNTNFSSQVREARAAEAEVVISQVTPPDGIALLKEMKAQGYDPEVVFLEKAGNTGGFPEISDGLAEGSLAANWFAEGMGLDQEQEFIKDYAEELGGVNSDLGNVVYGYSIARVLFDAIERAASVDADAVNEEIGKTDGTFPAGHIAFSDDHTAALPAVQTQWVGSDQVLVLNAEGEATDKPIVSPMPGLK